MQMPEWDDAKANRIKAIALDMAEGDKVVAALVVATILVGMTPTNGFMYQIVATVAKIADELAIKEGTLNVNRPH